MTLSSSGNGCGNGLPEFYSVWLQLFQCGTVPFRVAFVLSGDAFGEVYQQAGSPTAVILQAPDTGAWVQKLQDPASP